MSMTSTGYCFFPAQTGAWQYNEGGAGVTFSYVIKNEGRLRGLAITDFDVNGMRRVGIWQLGEDSLWTRAN